MFKVYGSSTNKMYMNTFKKIYGIGQVTPEPLNLAGLKAPRGSKVVILTVNGVVIPNTRSNKKGE